MATATLMQLDPLHGELPSPSAAPVRDTLSSLTETLSSIFLGDASSADAKVEAPAPAAPVEPVVPAVPAVPSASIGCSAHGGFRTIVVMSDIEGNAERLNRIAKAAQRWTRTALEYENEVHCVLNGDFAPDSAWSPVDTLSQLLSWKRKGVATLKVSAEHVHVVLGGRELAMLRLVDRGASGELCMRSSATRNSVAAMQAALKNGPPVTPSAWEPYASAVRTVFGTLEIACTTDQDVARAHNVLALCTLLKLEALLAMTKRAAYVSERAPGLLRNVLRRKLKPALYRTFAEDASLRCPPGGGTGGAWIATQLVRFISTGGDDLNADGHALVPVAHAALMAMANYVSETVLPLLRASVLVDAIAPPVGESSENAAWFLHGGTGDGRGGTIVGKLPASVSCDDGTLRVAWHPAPQSAAPWHDVLNAEFQSFLVRWLRGDPCEDAAAWIALSTPASESGPTQSTSQFPLEGLGSNSVIAPTIGAVAHASAPFARVERKLEAHKTLGWWLNSDTEGFATEAFGVITWCAKMRAKLTAAPPLTRALSLLDLQFDVDVILRTLASVWTGDVREKVGQLGPLVVAGRDGSELLRFVAWDDALALVPEAYLRVALEAYHTQPTQTRVAGGVSASITLSAVNAISLVYAAISATEALALNTELGPRVWRSQAAGPSKDATDQRGGAPTTTFQTLLASSDPLAGLRVVWRPAGKHATLRIAQPSEN
jgi:hypothetical protein